MLIISYRKKGIKLTHLWFANAGEADDIKECKKCGDVLFLHGVNKSKFGGGVLLTEQNTLIKDLQKSPEDIFSGFGKHLRKDIRNGIKDENLEIKLYSSEEISVNEEILSICRRLYEKMFHDKGMKVAFNMKLAKLYAEKNALFILVAYLEHNPVGFRAVIFSEEDARVWISAFDFRDEKYDSQVIGRANKRVYWETILHCRALGCRNLDLGGVNSFEDPNGIAKFKLEFEKENKVTYNNYLVPCTLLGKIAIKLFMRKWR